MCLVIVAFDVSRRYPLMIAANRDELHARPATPASWWTDQPRMFAGRDLVDLGVDGPLGEAHSHVG